MKLIGVIADITWAFSIKKEVEIALLKVVVDHTYSTEPEIRVIFNCSKRVVLSKGDRIKISLTKPLLKNTINYTTKITTIPFSKDYQISS